MKTKCSLIDLSHLGDIHFLSVRYGAIHQILMGCEMAAMGTERPDAAQHLCVPGHLGIERKFREF